VKVSPLDEPINIINYHRQRLDIIELLLEYTKRDDAVNIPNNDGNTPFHLAIIHDELDIVQYLFEDTNEGPDITLFNNDGNNALHLGVIHNRVNIVKYLVKYAKASIAEVNLNNHNAISLAEEDGNDELVEYLTSAYTKQSILNSYNTYHLRNFFGSDFSDFSEDLSESGTLDYSD
jgi:ankyrin repeat protein